MCRCHITLPQGVCRGMRQSRHRSAVCISRLSLLFKAAHAWFIFLLSSNSSHVATGNTHVRVTAAYAAAPLHCWLDADNPKFQAVYKNITADGAKLVLLLRLSPLIPFNLLNYGLGKGYQSHQSHIRPPVWQPCVAQFLRSHSTSV